MHNSGAEIPNQMDTSHQSDFTYPVHIVVPYEWANLEDLVANYRLLINAATTMENLLEQFSLPKADLTSQHGLLIVNLLVLSLIKSKRVKQSSVVISKANR